MAVAAMAQTLQGVTDARLSTLLQASQPPADFSICCWSACCCQGFRPSACLSAGRAEPLVAGANAVMRVSGRQGELCSPSAHRHL
jgi:hypothetical protein